MVTQDTAEVLPLVKMHLCWKEWCTETTLVTKSDFSCFDPVWKECRGKYDFTQTHLKQRRRPSLLRTAAFKSRVSVQQFTFLCRGTVRTEIRRYKRNYQRNVAQLQMEQRKWEAQMKTMIMKVDWNKNSCFCFCFLIQMTQMRGNQDLHRIGVHIYNILKWSQAREGT